VYKELSEKVFVGDSSVGEGPNGDDRKERKKAFEEFLGKLKEVCILITVIKKIILSYVPITPR
jgi:hypothetical protein